MKFPNKNRLSSNRGRKTRALLSFLIISLAAVGTLCWDAPSAFGTPQRHPPGSLFAQAYPPAFIAFMDTEFGRMWMHTVQERVVRRMYVLWLEKNFPVKKDK